MNPLPRLSGFALRANYHWSWSDPRAGTGPRALKGRADDAGVIVAPAFPEGGEGPCAIAAKLVQAR